MAANPDDFAPTVQGELPNPLFPLADETPRLRIVAKPTGRKAPAPIAFPDPEKLMREREARARDDRRRDNLTFIAEQQQAQEIASAFAAGRKTGDREGYVAGVSTGLLRGGLAGLIVGAALVIGFLKLGIAFA